MSTPRDHAHERRLPCNPLIRAVYSSMTGNLNPRVDDGKTCQVQVQPRSLIQQSSDWLRRRCGGVEEFHQFDRQEDEILDLM